MGLNGAQPVRAAYIELNPVRAGLCADPKDYRYCGYAEALAKGCSLARQGIRIVLGQSDGICWKEVSRQYRKYLFAHGSLNTKTKRPAFDLATAQTVVDQQKGELSLPERLLSISGYLAAIAPSSALRPGVGRGSVE